MGQRTCARHSRWDFCHSNPPSPFGPITTHTSPAICTGLTLPLDSHMWTERTDSMRLPRGALEGQRIFILARSRGRKVGTACICTIDASLVWMMADDDVPVPCDVPYCIHSCASRLCQTRTVFEAQQHWRRLGALPRGDRASDGSKTWMRRAQTRNPVRGRKSVPTAGCKTSLCFWWGLWL